MNSRKKDYYEVLGLDRDCTVEEIKAYRKFAMQYPDVNNGNAESSRKFKKHVKRMQF